MLQLRFLGQFDVRADGKRLLISTRAAQSLFSFLVLTAGTPHRREKIAGLLWPDVTDENARRSLRQELWRLRKALNSQTSEGIGADSNEYLVAEELTITFNPAAPYWLDLAQFEAPVSGDETLNDLTRQLALYKGELLPGFYEDWVLLERERVEQVFERKMQQLVELLVQQERWTAALEWGERWIAQGHTPEPAYRALMLAHGALGNPSQVTVDYERCVHALENELGVEPSEETRVLYDHLLKGAQLHLAPVQPSATVTFLFTDIEGSTRLLERLREHYAVVLHEHHEILRAAVQKWNGREIDTQGDAFFVTFARAADAVGCAVDAQRALSAHAWTGREVVRVRMGLHTGEPLMATTGYIGMDVHRAARIGDAGHGGQVLLSQTTRDLIVADLPENVTLRALGEHRLKDLKFPTEIYQLVIEGLPNDFSPLRSVFGQLEPPAPGEPPFKGLEYFDESDAGLFFGREALSAKLANTLRENRFLAVVVGASGSGKSSVVRAGLLPALKATDDEWRVFVMTPTAHPLEALAATLTRETESVTAMATLLDDLVREPRALQLYLRRLTEGERQRQNGLGPASPLLAKQPAPSRAANASRSEPDELRPPPCLLVVDQFEELFTLCREEFEREQFVDNLLDAVNASKGAGATRSRMLTLVLTIRADFYSHLAQYPELRDAVAQHQEYIGAMNVEELRRAIEEPARRGGWEFEPGLVDLMLRDVDEEPGALPLLSHALLETWKRRVGHRLTLKGYADAGGVRGAIAQTAETTFQNLTPPEQVLARDLFLRLTQPGEGTEDTRRRVSLDELLPGGADGAAVRAVLTRLADARLVTTHEHSAQVAHEALIREWPRLREWLNEDREGLTLHRHLTEAAHEWALLERDPSALYRGVRLAQAREWASSHAERLNELERAFLEASQAQEQREAQGREEQRERELLAAQTLAETQTRAAHQLRRRAMFVAGGFALALILAVVAFLLMGVAQNQSAIAKARSTQTQSLALSSAAQLAASRENPELGLAYALAANRLQPRAIEAQAPLADLAYATGLQHIFTGHTSSVASIAVSPEGTTALSTGALSDHSLILWDLHTGKLIRQFKGHTSSVFAVAFSPDGKTAVSASEDTTLILWDVATGQMLRQFRGHTLDVWAAILSRDGNLMLSGADDESIILWQVATGKILHRITGQTGLFSLAMSADGTTALAGYTDGKIILWDLAREKPIRTIQGHADAVTSVEFSPDGKRALSSSVDKTVALWDVASGQLLRRLHGHTDAVNIARFSPNGKTALSGGGSGTSYSNILDRSLIWWDLKTGQILERFQGPQPNIIGLAFSPDGKSGLAGSADKTMVLWGLDSGAQRYRLDAHSSPVNAVAYSPDGTRGASGAADGTIIIWDAPSGEVLQRVPGASIINAIAYSPDGKNILSGAVDGALTLRDAETGRVVQKFIGHTPPVTAVAFSPDGKTALSGSIDRSLLLWDVASGQILHRLEGHTNAINSVAYSPDGKRALSGGYDRAVLVWDVETGLLLKPSPAQASVVNSVAFSPDGKTALFGLADGTIAHWEIEQGYEILRFVGHAGAVKSVVFTPDGKMAISGGLDHRVIVWDVESGQAIRHLLGHADTVNTIAVSPDGTTALSGSVDRTVREWRIDSLDDLVRWTQAHRIVAAVPCAQRVLYNLTPCDAATAKPTP